MPFLRQAPGVKLRPNNAVFYRSSIRFASHSNKHKKSNAEAKLRSDHNETGQEKRQRSFWKSIAPDFLTQETNASSSRGGHFAQASTFKLYASHGSASKPIVEASSTSWDSKTNKVSHTVYDPISGRMVPANGQSGHNSASIKSKKNKPSKDKTYEKPTFVSQLPENIEALSNTPTTHASFTEDFDKTYQSERDELLATRRHLDTLREQIQILERQTHPEMTKPHYAVDAERPAVFEGGWDDNPKGLQTAFKLEKEACEHGDMKPLEQEMDALNKITTQEVSNDYSIAPSGLETLFANEQTSDDIRQKSSLEQELVAMNTQAPPIDDGYSPSPQGLETLFEQEQHSADLNECKTLEDEVRMAGSAADQTQYIAGLTKGPTGLETMFDQEQQGTPQRLELELESMTSTPGLTDQHDAYSTKPTGMQTLFEREAKNTQNKQHKDLEHELHDHIRALKNYPSANLNGMQTLWEREQKDVEMGNARSLEDEIAAKQKPQPMSNECDTSVFGLETNFRNEAQRVKEGDFKTLEQEVSHRVQAQIHDDGHARPSESLETAFQNESKNARLGKRQSLEKEIKSPELGFEDDSPTTPMGLQMLFHRDKQSSERSLEEDLKQMEEASYHEDGYSRAPIGMVNSFEKGIKDETTSLEADLKDMPGEGDLSPTVGKFATRDQWYKQPARSTFSEDYLKAEVRKPDRRTAVSGRSLDEGLSKPIESNVPSANTATATKHSSTQTTSIKTHVNPSLEPESGSDIKWREPALYKVIAYDSSKDAITLTRTPSKFSNSETPLSIPQAISQLSLAARFLPHIAASQNEGFHVIHAERDYLVSRMVHKDPDPRAPRYEAITNPIDGTTRYTPVEPPISRFASPTGFVNYEPIFPTEPMHNRQDMASSFFGNGHPEFQQHTIYPHTRIPAKPPRSIFRHADAKFRNEKRRRWRRRIVWIVSVAAGTAVCTTYVIGVSGELAKSDKRIAQPAR